ncbi:phosphoribosyltransferase [Acuticoccus sp. M5D2P5]|uniref:phosphoribosyltransferase n=1 Tax=Acuticoccus kalidii TaxID=2910977 RepID=UPI001F1C013A|nr:phosphoribosyltransferase [Acuticoccus kalidii]MCF3934834.1 phosphoribosyltransferase [Acuticoccus kalidii]
MFFVDRREAGRRLAAKLTKYRGMDAIVLALPRGGVPVAFEVARTLELPLDIMLVRKLGVPGHEELAMGAIANGNVEVLNNDIVAELGIGRKVIEAVAKRERSELIRRNALYRAGCAAPVLAGRTVILVDDGIATGADMRAATQAVAAQNPARIVVAAPVASEDAVTALREIADEVVALKTPEPFVGVGLYYNDFSQTSDSEVVRLRVQADSLSN